MFSCPNGKTQRMFHISLINFVALATHIGNLMSYRNIMGQKTLSFMRQRIMKLHRGKCIVTLSHIWNTDRFLKAAVIHCRGVGSESLKTVELSKADVSLKILFHEYVNETCIFPLLSVICGLFDCIDFIQLPLNYYTQYITQHCTDFIVSAMTIKFNLNESKSSGYHLLLLK